MDFQRLDQQINQLAAEAMSLQSPDGAWRLCFDSGTMTDSFFIILLRLLGLPEETLIRQLAERIASKQEHGGMWKLFPDQSEGDLDTTVEACLALLYSGYYSPYDARIVQAKTYIREQGGLAEIRSLLTQSLLAVTGQAKWPQSMRIPLAVLFSSHSFGLDLFSLSGHARVHLVPVAVMANEQFTVQLPGAPDLSELFLGDSARTKSFAHDSPLMSVLTGLLGTISATGLFGVQADEAKSKALTFLLERIEPNGTLLSYSTSSMLMIPALLAMGHGTRSPIILNAVTGIRSLMCVDRPHVQMASSEVWDTALISHALQQAGVSPQSPALERAAAYLSVRQQSRIGDWARRTPNTPAGGWGFSNVNTLYPDVDDSAAALRALRPYSERTAHAQANWQRGLNWVIAMRNKDGGWPAFERQGASLPASLFGFKGAEEFVLDPSVPDLTGRILQFMGDEAGMSTGHVWIEDTVRWLLAEQERDGSWYGRWGITYTHGTGAVLQSLAAVGVAADHPAIRKAVRWLLSIQNEDGGFGESCRSDIARKYVPLKRSTPSQTAWVLLGLTAVMPRLTPELEQCANALLRALERRNDWTFTYPTGAALAGLLYVHYTSYNYVYPLLALSAFRAKFGGGSGA
jgi:sporulenol synthase